MIAILVISESDAASELLKTVRKILGARHLKSVKPLCIPSHISPKQQQKRIEQQIKTFKNVSSVLILTELYGSTQSNLCCSFLQKNKVELLSGYNLPMLLKAVTAQSKVTSVKALVKECKKAAKKYIQSFCK